MKLIRSCQDKKTQAFLFSLLSLLFCALTTFAGFSTGCFYNGKLNASKIFLGVPCVSNPTDLWLYQGYHRVEAINFFGQGLGNVQLTEPHVLFVTDAMRVAGPTCVCYWQARTVAADMERDRCCAGANLPCSAEANGSSGVKCEMCQAGMRTKLLISASHEGPCLLLVCQHLF